MISSSTRFDVGDVVQTPGDTGCVVVTEAGGACQAAQYGCGGGCGGAWLCVNDVWKFVVNPC